MSGLRWTEGMRSCGEEAGVVVKAHGTESLAVYENDGYGWVESLWSPDLSDPPTQGAMLAQIEEAYGCYAWAAFHRVEGDPHWVVWLAEGTGDRVAGRGKTRGEAMRDALEARAKIYISTKSIRHIEKIRVVTKDRTFDDDRGCTREITVDLIGAVLSAGADRILPGDVVESFFIQAKGKILMLTSLRIRGMSDELQTSRQRVASFKANAVDITEVEAVPGGLSLVTFGAVSVEYVRSAP